MDEALRFGSPVRGFTRFALARYETETVAIPEGERVLILYGAANRDERHYADPDRFDVTRESPDHLAFGYGVHRCAGGISRSSSWSRCCAPWSRASRASSWVRRAC